MFILPSLALVVHGLSLAYITAYLFGMRLIILLIVFFQVNPLLKNNGKPLTFQHFNKLFNYGFWVTMTGLISPLMVYGDRFIISSIIGATTLAYYSIPQEGLFRLLVIPSAIGAALLPILTTAKEVEQKKLYQKNFKRVAYLMFGICLSTAALSYPMLAVWLGSEFANQSIGITLILVIGIFINSVSIIPYVFLQANGKPFIIAKFHLIELAAYLPLIFILVNNFGLIGAALAWAFRVLVDYILLTNAMRKEIDFTH
jgi:O-antigen/teichoic acid export membrane protein